MRLLSKYFSLICFNSCLSLRTTTGSLYDLKLHNVRACEILFCRVLSIQIGRKSDVWALGCILYLLMFGRPPFRGMHILKRLQSINSNRPVAIPDYPASPQLVEALRMCLLRDPNSRAAVSDLLAFLDKEPAWRCFEPLFGRNLRLSWKQVCKQMLPVLDSKKFEQRTNCCFMSNFSFVMLLTLCSSEFSAPHSLKLVC